VATPTLSKRYRYVPRRYTLSVRTAETMEDFMTAGIILDRTFGHLVKNPSYFSSLAPGCDHVLLAVESYQGYTSGFDYETIMGVYLLRKGNMITKSALPEIAERMAKYQGLRGVEGVALAVDPMYRGKGAGKLLREYSLTMDYDYIWGMQFKSLNNLDNWVKSGRELIYESGSETHGINCTARLMPDKVDKVDKVEDEEVVEEVSSHLPEEIEETEPFPIQIQRDAYSCGATCMEMYLRWVSRDPREVPDIEEIKEMCGTNPQTGTITEGLLSCLEAMFIPAWRSSMYEHKGEEADALQWLEDQLAVGRAFFVRTLTFGCKHWVLAYGYYSINGDRYWMIADPATGLTEFSDKTLVERWKARDWDGAVADISFAANMESWDDLLSQPWDEI
jgi:GNAT superfamily N-acetyltransferase